MSVFPRHRLALLEVKALITFALLFGSTWIVNSLVFFAILTSVLIAVQVNARFRVRRIWIFYTLLFGMLAQSRRWCCGTGATIGDLLR